MKKYAAQRNLLLFLFLCFFNIPHLIQAQDVAVTFHVDMQNEVVTTNGVWLAGTFSNWNLVFMTDDGDDTWSLTIDIPQQTTIQYRFYNGDTAMDIENGDNLEPCGEQGENGGFDRTFDVPTFPVDLPLVCFASCEPCPVNNRPQYVNACLGESLTICATAPNFLNEPLAYQWFDEAGNPVTTQSTDPCYNVEVVTLQMPTSFYCEISDEAGQVFTTPPFIIELLEEDAIGGKYYANQFMIKFAPGVDQDQRDLLRTAFQADLLDACMCDLELWSIPDGIEYPPGSGNILIDDEDKKQTAKNEPEIEEVDFNYQTEEEAIVNHDAIMSPSLNNPPPPMISPCTALNFDGVDDVVTMNGNPTDGMGTNDFTVEAWIKGDNSVQVANPLILSTRNNANDGFMFFLADFGGPNKKLALQMNSINYLDLNTPNVLDGTSHHVAIVKTNTQLFYYIDGLLNFVRTIPPNLSINSSHPLWIGKDPNTPASTAFNGLIEEVRVWNIARTTEEILQTAKISLRGNEADLLAYWDMKEGSGQFVQDKTGNGYNGLLGGNTFVESTDPIWGNECCFKIPVLSAVIDGGMQDDHPDLFSHIWVNSAENIDGTDEDTNCATDDRRGYSYAEDNNDAYDAIFGHGTHVGGLVVKTAEEGFGSTDPDVLKLLNLKVFDNRNKGNLFDAACAIFHAADKGAKVINCSWGYYGLPTGVVIKAIEEAGQDCGALVITSAGNKNYPVFDSLHYPGNHNEVFLNMLQIGAVDTVRDNQYEIDCFSLMFDGVDDLVEIPNNDIGNILVDGDFTMEVWIEANDNQAQHPLLFSNYGINNEGFRFYFHNSFNGNKLLAMELDGTVYAAINTPFAFDNNCHHLAAVRSNNELLLYMDGNLLEIFDIEGNPNLNSSFPLWMGKDALAPTNYIYQGLMEEVRFWNRGLSANEIQNHAQQQVDIFSSNLIAYYKMNDIGMGKIKDEISGFDGFLGRTEEVEPIDPIWLTDCCVIDSFLVSSTLDFQSATYSNYSDTLVDVATWGLHNSTVPMDAMGWKIGTSMASGVMAGVAARLFYENPAAQWPEVKQCILDSSTNPAELTGFVKKERFFDANLDLELAIDCIRNIIPNTENDCMIYNPNALALELLNFNGILQKEAVLLNWDIISSTPILKFEIERLNEQAAWISIAQVAGKSSQGYQKQDYQTTDASPQIGANFYRLKVFYEDGKTEESHIVLVEVEAKTSWQIYPNPANAFIQVETKGENHENTILHIYNYAGIELKRVSLAMENHITDLSIADLPNGLYLLAIKNGEEILMQERLVKMGH